MAVVALVAAGVTYTVTGGVGRSGSVDFPEGHPYLCRDCGELTILTRNELLDLKAEARESNDPEAQRVPCAACGSKNTHPALKCPRCGEYMSRPGSGRLVCQHCKQPFPSLFDDEDE
ncbi:MAG TPA: hypothetical protein VM487_22290 [Phycisphaerae bacterium]|nr:hypothetical protein [Phycisphaerae bacterium]